MPALSAKDRDRGAGRSEYGTVPDPRTLVPFRLWDVRLLDAPFRTIQVLNHDYLLMVEPDRLLAGFREHRSRAGSEHPEASERSHPILIAESPTELLTRFEAMRTKRRAGRSRWGVHS